MMRTALWLAFITALAAGLSATTYTFKTRPEGFARWWNGNGIAIFIILWLLLGTLVFK